MSDRNHPLPRAGRLWAALVAALGLGLGPLPAAALSFDEALALAEQAPALQGADARLAAARHAAVPAGALPDPKLAVGIENLPVGGPDRWRLTADGMTMQRIVLMQELPNRAKREARVAAAQAGIERAGAERRVAALAARREAALAWIRRHTLERQLAALEGLFDENRLLERSVQAQLAGGRGAATDAVMPRQEAAELATRRDELLAQRQQAVAALARWIGEAAQAPLAGEPPRWAPRRDALLGRLTTHPGLATVDATARLLDAELREAEAMKRPDWGIELAYQRRGSAFGDMVSAQLSVDLPIFAARRQDPRIAARAAERAALEAERESLRRELVERLSADWAEFERLDRAAARQRDELLPLAQQKVDLALAAYRGGRAPLNEFVAARRERLEARLAAVALEGERQRMAAQLRFALDSSEDTEGASQ